MNCILIETNDNRKFLVAKEDIPNLKEYLKTFKAKTKKVKANPKDVISLSRLAKDICDNTKGKSELKYEEIKTQKEKSPKIKELIEKKLLSNEIVSISKIKSDLNNEFADQTVYYHLRNVKNKLQKKGITIIKIKKGEYKTI
jgi:hypothetical protein